MIQRTVVDRNITLRAIDKRLNSELNRSETNALFFRLAWQIVRDLLELK